MTNRNILSLIAEHRQCSLIGTVSAKRVFDQSAFKPEANKSVFARRPYIAPLLKVQSSGI